jgi:glucokinase
MGFDLGGTKMMAKLFDGRFRALARGRKKAQAQEGQKAGIERIVGLIGEVLAEGGIGKGRLLGIGIGTPGPLDLDRGVVLHLPNMGWRNVPLRSILRKQFGCAVEVVNDVDAGVYGEYRFGAGKGARCLLGVFPGTGIGGGCVYRGDLLRGRSTSCLEIGHIRVLPDGPLCGCGKRGCLESVASRLAVAAAAAAAAHRGEAPHLLKECGMDLGKMKSGALAEAIRAGDGAVERIVRDAARWIGVAIASAVDLIAPDTVVLGGGMVGAMPDLFLQEVESSARRHVMPAFRDSFDVRLAKLGDEATAMGAAGWAQHCAEVRPS